MFEAINIAINLNFESSPDIKYTKHELQKLFTLATSETLITFNGSIFGQIDGVSMGFPLLFVLAYLFMGFHDDAFYSYLNTRHENIKLTFKKMKDNKFPFPGYC